MLSVVFQGSLDAVGNGWFTIAAAVGVAIGLVGLLVVQVIRQRAGQSADGSAG